MGQGQACAHKVARPFQLRLAVLLPVEERLRTLWPVVLPLKGAVVQADVVKAAAARLRLPVTVVLAPLQACKQPIQAEEQPGCIAFTSVPQAVPVQLNVDLDG